MKNFYQLVQITQTTNVLLYFIGLVMKIWAQLSFPDKVHIDGPEYVDMGPTIRVRGCR